MQHAMSAFTRVRVSAGQWRDDPRRRDVLVDGVRAFLAVSLRKLLIVFPCPQKAAPRGPSRGLARSVSVGGLTKFAAGPVERGRAVFKHTRSGRNASRLGVHPTDRLGGALESAGRLACI
jgi:hypothetical protein